MRPMPMAPSTAPRRGMGLPSTLRRVISNAPTTTKTGKAKTMRQARMSSAS